MNSAQAVTVQNAVIVVVHDTVRLFPVAVARFTVEAEDIVAPCANHKTPVIVPPAVASFVCISS